jgi:hypothetical protein
MRNAVVRRPSNKGLLGKASSIRVARRPTNVTVMTPATPAELSRWYDDQEYQRGGRPIPRPVEIHYHHTHVEKRDWGNVVGLAGGTFAAAAMGLMWLPSLVTALVFTILFMVLGCLVVAGAVSTFRGLPLSRLLLGRHLDQVREQSPSR